MDTKKIHLYYVVGNNIFDTFFMCLQLWAQQPWQKYIDMFWVFEHKNAYLSEEQKEKINSLNLPIHIAKVPYDTRNTNVGLNLILNQLSAITYIVHSMRNRDLNFLFEHHGDYFIPQSDFLIQKIDHDMFPIDIEGFYKKFFEDYEKNGDCLYGQYVHSRNIQYCQGGTYLITNKMANSIVSQTLEQFENFYKKDTFRHNCEDIFYNQFIRSLGYNPYYMKNIIFQVEHDNKNFVLDQESFLHKQKPYNFLHFANNKKVYMWASFNILNKNGVGSFVPTT
jgi:hypothetical protein